MNNLENLKKPFPANKIHWRVGARAKDKKKGIALAYIDARDVMERLDEVVGMSGWQRRHPFAGCCEIGIEVDGRWIWKADGAGDVIVREQAKEEEQSMKEKGNYSDSFKRAAASWGIGRYLYDLPQLWVELDDYGGISKETKASLTQRLDAWQTKKFG